MSPAPQECNDRMVDSMRASGILQSPDVERAFRRVLRHHFLPDLDPAQAYVDEAIVTHQRGESHEWISSSSQPTMMAIMLQQLEVQPGMRVLEIGAGTGYNAALLAELAGRDDLVWTVDVTEEFCAEARAHLAAAGHGGVQVVHADGWAGWPAAAPYDRIIVTASAYDIAPAWAAQLRDGGLLALPWGLPQSPQQAICFQKQADCFVQQSSRPCFFMSLRGRHEHVSIPAVDSPDHWEMPWTRPVPPPDSRLEDLVFFLSLFFWPLAPTVFWPGETEEAGPRRLGLLDPSRRIVLQAAPEEGWKLSGSDGWKMAEALQERTAQWLRGGRPTPDQLRLTACPHGQKTGWARREWFDYRVQWAHGDSAVADPVS